LQERIAAYDRKILETLDRMTGEERRGLRAPEPKNKEKARGIERRGEEPLRQARYRSCGVDLTSIDAVGVRAVEVVVSEYGMDLSRFPTESQFVSPVNLAPRTRVTGGKPIQKNKRGSASTRAAAVLRMAATSMRHSRSTLGAYYRQLARRPGDDVAVFATAPKLAQLIYRMLRWGQPYVDVGAEAYERATPSGVSRESGHRANDLGYELIPTAQCSPC
jgi:transposase